jgi:hypothetical protein
LSYAALFVFLGQNSLIEANSFLFFLVEYPPPPLKKIGEEGMYTGYVESI